MENTLENKAKFFAQYWGQKIWLQDSVDWIFNIEPSMMKDGIIEISSLLLTPISDITMSLFVGLRSIATNGSRLGEVGDFENETLKLLLNLN